MTNDPAQVPILVVSCDAYADIWGPFAQAFRHYWPDCPFTVHVGSNDRPYMQDPNFRALTVGPDNGWTDGLSKMLHALPGEHVILLLDDFFLTARPQTGAILEAVQMALDRKLGCVRLAPLPPPTPLPPHPVADHPQFGRVPVGSPFRVSAQAAVWSKKVLLRLLQPGLSPWQFEHYGTRLSAGFPEEFWGPFAPLLHYDHVIEKGRWKPEGLALCERLGIAVDIGVRGAFAVDEYKKHMANSNAPSPTQAARTRLMDAVLNGNRRDSIAAGFAGLSRDLKSLALPFIGIAGAIFPGLVARAYQASLNRRIRQMRPDS
jgi:hypothetical protein